MNLRQLIMSGKRGVTYSAFESFTKNKGKIQKFKETGDSQYVYQNEPDYACFQHNISYGDFKGLSKRTASDKVLRDKAFDIAKTPKHDGYQRVLASVLYRRFDKRSSVAVKSKLHRQYCGEGGVILHISN